MTNGMAIKIKSIAAHVQHSAASDAFLYITDALFYIPECIGCL